MKQILITIIVLMFFACGKEKSVVLPEIENAKITEVNDVSPAYLFYDETQPDSLELNKNNLIVSTNWLVNVDKRLTLKQAIPAIIKLQEKKRNSSHKNESARNYYTCNDTSIKNLGFIDFTDVVYDYESEEIESKNTSLIAIVNLNKIIIYALDGENYETDISNLKYKINELSLKFDGNSLIVFTYSNRLTFQDYITFKSKLSTFDFENTTINNEEFIFN